MKLHHALLALVLATAASACASKQAQMVAGVSIKEDKAGSWEKTKLSADSALSIALVRVPGGKLTGGELEEEDGRLIYSFDISVAGAKGLTEVHIDALTGAVIKVEKEDG